MRLTTNRIMTTARHHAEKSGRSVVISEHEMQVMDDLLLLEMSNDSSEPTAAHLETIWDSQKVLTATFILPRPVKGLAFPSRAGDLIKAYEIEFGEEISGFEITGHSDETNFVFGSRKYGSVDFIRGEAPRTDVPRFLLNRLLNFTIDPIMTDHFQLQTVS